MALFMDADAYCAKIMEEIERGFNRNLDLEPPGIYGGRKLADIALEIYDMVKDIKDPERPESLEDLSVLSEECVQVKRIAASDSLHVVITFVPTVPHCSLAALIGLCLRVKLQRSLPLKFKLDLFVKKGTHNIEDEVNKQINDKERVAAALENPSLQKLVEECILESI